MVEQSFVLRRSYRYLKDNISYLEEVADILRRVSLHHCQTLERSKKICGIEENLGLLQESVSSSKHYTKNQVFH